VDNQAVLAATRHWVAKVVIGLDLCPFARRVFQEDKIRFVVTDAADEVALLDDLRTELQALGSAPAPGVETTLLIHPHVLADFLDYNDFLNHADQLVVRLGLLGVVQIASFHPAYRYADAAADAVENYTNRSPYPMLHLLLERSVSAVAGAPEQLLAIPRRNIQTLRTMGIEKILDLLQ
jgi:hypothetical protein